MRLLELAAAPPTGAAPWLGPLRAEARAALEERGLPGTKTEAWRFTSVRALRDEDFALDADALAVRVTGEATVERVRPVDDSCAPSPFGKLAARDYFAGVNASAFPELVVVRVAAGAAAAVELDLRPSTELTLPRVFVEVGEGASLELVERALPSPTPAPDGLALAVIELALAPNAQVHHVRLQVAGRVISEIAARLERSSRYEQRLVSLGGTLLRTDLKVDLAGEGAECVLRGAYHVRGRGLTREHVDHHVRVLHSADRTRSEVDHRGLLDEEGESVFDAQTLVLPGVRGAEAHQSNRNLLLSSGATCHTKPHLEISNDDVVASHGATVGALDPDALFYLRQRGVPLEKATALLTHSFLRAALDGMRDAALHAELDAALRDRLPHAEVLALELGSDEDEWDELEG